MMTPSDEKGAVPPIPVGLEELVSMGAASEEFAGALLDNPGETARASGVEMTATEQAMLRAIPAAQLAQVIGALGLPPEGTPSRCMVCNGRLLEISRDIAQPRVPPYVFETQAVFHQCESCGRVTWTATHWEGTSSCCLLVMRELPPMATTAVLRLSFMIVSFDWPDRMREENWQIGTLVLDRCVTQPAIYQFSNVPMARGCPSSAP